MDKRLAYLAAYIGQCPDDKISTHVSRDLDFLNDMDTDDRTRLAAAIIEHTDFQPPVTE